jgi:hypothetical protein
LRLYGRIDRRLAVSTDYSSSSRSRVPQLGQRGRREGTPQPGQRMGSGSSTRFARETALGRAAGEGPGGAGTATAAGTATGAGAVAGAIGRKALSGSPQVMQKSSSAGSTSFPQSGHFIAAHLPLEI